MTVPIGDRLGLDIKRTEQALMAAKSAVLRPHDLNVAQYAALLTLRESPGISGAGLARACLVTPQAVSSVLKSLERRNLVERVRDDWKRNSSRLTLTPNGRHLLARADRDASAVERRILDTLDETDRATLRELLERCTTALQD